MSDTPKLVDVTYWDSIDEAVMAAASEAGDDVPRAWQYDVHVNITTFRHSDQVKRIEVNHEQRIIWLWGVDDEEDE